MPFKKIDVEEERNKRINNDEELKKEYFQVKREYELIKQVAEARKEKGLTQTDVANETV